MPTTIEHIAQAQHNRQFWSGYNAATTLYQDWMVTGIFYEGVHWVEALLSQSGEHSFDHKQRSAAMLRHPSDFNVVAADLEVLKTDSENARYRCYKHTAKEINDDLIPLINNIQTQISQKLHLPI